MKLGGATDVELTQPALTRVNGIGQWNAWTRNFNSPHLALLDLFDNSIDAAMKPAKRNEDAAMTDHQPSGNDSDDSDDEEEEEEDEEYRGRIEVEADWWNQSTFGDDDESDGGDDDYDDVDGEPLETITGIVLTNNSHRPIKPLEKILEAYSSAKGREEHGEDHQEGEFAETIGENGVGLKQGCAVLSDLSFVLIRRGDDEENKFSLGFIAKRLQRPEGISLPSVEFVSDELVSLREEMRTRLAGTAVGECVARYGAGSLNTAINRLISHFRQMSSHKNGGWGHFSEVFRVVLHDVKGSSASNSNSIALSLMDEINSALPSTYIHLPENVEVRVNGQVIEFNSYQSRLIELTAFYQKIDRNTPVGDKKDWQQPEHGYNIRLLFGFDASRKGGRPRLCIHSRQSGRLVKSVEDCRAILGLTTGSTDFCQGLTVIADDMHGHLPLNPTKQDIAFGEQGEAGDVHRRNLFSWIGGYTSLFYNMHRDKKFGGSKRSLSAAISRLSSQQDALTWDGPCLDDCEFTEYKDILWKFIKATGNIRCGNLKKVSVSEVGRDTRWRFDDLPEVAHAAKTASPPRSNPRPKKKRQAEKLRSVNQDCGIPEHDLMLPGSSLQAAVRAGLSRKRSPASGDKLSTLQSRPSEPDYKKLYEELKKEHEKLRGKYQEKKNHKELAKSLTKKVDQSKNEIEQLKNVLDIERKRREEELEEKEEVVHEKDGIIERLKKKITRQEERIKSLDAICSPRKNGETDVGTRQVSL